MGRCSCSQLAELAGKYSCAKLKSRQLFAVERVGRQLQLCTVGRDVKQVQSFIVGRVGGQEHLCSVSKIGGQLQLFTFGRTGGQVQLCTVGSYHAGIFLLQILNTHE